MWAASTSLELRLDVGPVAVDDSPLSGNPTIDLRGIPAREDGLWLGGQSAIIDEIKGQQRHVTDIYFT